MPVEKHLRGLYIITPDWDDSECLLATTETALKEGAALVQYRHKTANHTLRRAQGAALLALCQRYDVPLIINDHVDLCLELNADGVHVGGADASVAAVRAELGPQRIIGASCYGSLQRAHAAWQAGASYVALGGFYPSRMKQYKMRTDPAIIAQAKAEIPLPVVVIGGMTADNAPPLIAQGADMVAAISSVYLVPEAQQQARALAGLYQ